jgi:hypothetical protein
MSHIEYCVNFAAPGGDVFFGCTDRRPSSLLFAALWCAHLLILALKMAVFSFSICWASVIAEAVRRTSQSNLTANPLLSDEAQCSNVYQRLAVSADLRRYCRCTK